MRRWIIAVLVLAFWLLPQAHEAEATLSAHFEISQLANICNVEDTYDVWPANVAPDLSYYAVIANLSAQVLTDWSVCDSGGPDNRCGSWDFTNQHLTATITNGSTAYFYFGLFDVDDGDADDSVGNHWVRPYTSMSSWAWTWNNDAAYPDYQPVCGDNNEYDDWNLANNWQLYHRIYYQDDTAPTGMGYPSYTDDSITNPSWENDTRFDVTWAAASDPETGISAYHFNLYDRTSSAYVYNTASAPIGRSMSLCPSGCTNTFTPAHNHQYAMSIRATNSNYPRVDPTRTTWGAERTIWVDREAPVTSVAGPTGGTWHGASSIAVTMTDTDSGAGIDTSSCRYQVTSGGSTITRSWTSRTCGTGPTLTIGSSGLCRHQGANTCKIEADSDDLARLASTTTSRTFSIDWTADSISSIIARPYSTSPIVIGESDWTSVRDPYFSFTLDTSNRIAPIAGYSWAVDTDPDCAAMEVGGGDSGSVQLSANSLTEGVHTFRVRPKDAAGVCGTTGTHTIQVDYTQDVVSNLRAFTYEDGSPIGNGVWQQDNDPYLVWDPASSTSPIAGYAFGTGSRTDCVVDTSSHSTALSPLPEGVNTFWVRAIDAAGNCGAATTFNIAVDRTGETVSNLEAFDWSGGTPILPDGWQYDNDPWLTWNVSSSLSQLVGYSVGLGSDTDCTVEVTARAAGLTGLPDGLNIAWVRAVDSAGNCGPATTVVIPVDRTGDGIPNLRAYTEPGGILVAEAAWQQDNVPYFVWDVPSSAAPMAGYSVALDAEPPCEATIAGTSYTPAIALTDEVHLFNVRGLDSVDNCGPVDSFEIWVANAGPTLTIHSLTPDPARALTRLVIRVSSPSNLETYPTVTLSGGRATTYLGEVDGIYSYDYLVVGDEVSTSDPTGAPVTVLVEAVTVGGVPGSTAGAVVFDFNPPSLVEPMIIDPPVTTTTGVVFFEFESNEPLLAAPLPTVMVDGTNPAVFVSQSGSRYRYGYEVTGGEGEGLVQVAATLVDLAGNQHVHVETFELDMTPPVVTFLAPDHRVVADLGTTLTIEWNTVDLHPDTVTIYLSRDGGATYPDAIIEDLPDTGSAQWTVSGEQSNRARLRVVASDAVGLTGFDSGSYDFRIRQPLADHVIANVDDGVATVQTNEGVNLTVVDSLGDPVEGAFEIAVTLSGLAVFTSSTLTGSTTGSQVIAGTTDSHGEAILEVTDAVAELVQVTPAAAGMPAVVGHIPAYVNFTPAGADHLVAHVDDGVSDVGDTETLTIVAVDATGNPTSSNVVVRVQTTGSGVFTSTSLQAATGTGTSGLVGRLGSDGTATVDLTDGLAEVVWVSASSDALGNVNPDESATVIFAQISQVDPSQVTIEADPERVYADGVAVSEITVIPRNAVGAVLGSGLFVEVFTDFGDLTEIVDEGDGSYVCRLSSEECPEEPTSIDARVEDVLIEDGAWVTFTCDAVASATLTAEPETIVADGETCSDVTLSLLDDAGDPMDGGQAVRLRATYGTLSDIEETTEGQYRAELCSTLCAEDPIVVRATVNGVSLTELNPPLELEVPVECLPVDPAASSIEASPATMPADGYSASTITVTPVRLDGVGMGVGMNVVIHTTLGELTSTYDAGNGTYTAQLTSLDEGEAVVTAAVTGIELASSARVTFVRPAEPLVLVDLRALAVQGEPTRGATVSLPVEVVNDSSWDLDQVWVSVETEGEGLSLAGWTWRGEPVSAVFDEEAGWWRIDLGTVLHTDGGADRIEVSVTFADEATGELALGWLAHRSLVTVSEEERVVFDLEASVSPSPPEEACYCGRIAGPTQGIWPIGWLMCAYLLCRRRPRA